ncbi:hypothetical protein MMC13_003303 [Lambiella insularis]|nr:hypothetical protein [Lambiella insularis]
MAPIVKKRTQLRSRASKPSTKSHPRPSSTYASTDDAFKSTKEDKRRIKHSKLISRIEKANTKVKKPRRPSKKLLANLESLVDALPDPDEKGKSTGETVIGDARIRHRSLKSKPGAMKQRAKLEKLEMNRFSQNMAQMAHVTGDGDNRSTTDDVIQTGQDATGGSGRWAALRGFIQSTLDRDVATRPS